MSYLTLPKRVFNSPLIEYANFKDGSHINLIKLIKPYANGISYAVYETTKNPFCSNGLFKTYEKAKEKFDLMVKNQLYESELRDQGKTNNFEEKTIKKIIVSIDIETEKTIETIIGAIKKGIYYGLDCHPSYVAQPSKVKINYCTER